MKKFTMLMAAAAVALSASAEMYMIGEPAGGWAPDKGILMEEVETGVYTITGDYAGKYFGFASQLCSEWDGPNGINSFRYGARAGNNTQATIGTHALSTPNSNSFVGQPGELKYTIDTNKMTLTVEGEVVEVEKGYALHGNIFTGTSEWTTKELKLENGFYTLTSEVFSGMEFGLRVIKAGDLDTQLQWIGGNVTIDKEGDYTLTEGANSKLNIGGNCTFTYNPETSVLSVKVNTLSTEHWYIIGAGVGSWENDVEMTAVEDGTWTWTGNINGEFKFRNAKNWDAEPSTIVLGSIDTENPEIISENGTYTLTNDRAGQNLSINADSVTLTLNPAAKTLKVTGLGSTGVTAVEAANGEAVYFNMQGVRVANPENGLFIRVQNGKAVKVVK